MKRMKLLAVAVLALLLPVLAAAQAISGDLVGTVTDKSGAAVAGASVVATNVGTNIKSTSTTNGAGEYRFTNLPVGEYNITATAKGFSTVTQRGVSIELNKTGTANFSMEVGSVSTTVEVSESAAPAIDTTTAQIQSNYDELQLRDTPNATQGQGVLNLSLLQAGVGSANSLGDGTGPSVGGQRPRNNNFTIEGVDNNDKGVTGPVVYVPNDAVAEFSVLTNQFSPEFGHSSGGQFNTVVISGTNSFHGRVYEYLQNRNLNAADTQRKNANLPKSRYDNNRFGGQVGGPIFKNKLFFFGNFEYNPIGRASIASPILAPTAAGYTTLAGIPGLNQATVGGMKQYATAPSVCDAGQIAQGVCPGSTVSVNSTPVEIGVVPINAPNYQNGEFLTTSMDYNLSDRDQIRGRYIYNKYTTIDTASQQPVFYTNLILPYHLVTLAEYHTFSPSLTNELRLGYNRSGYNYTVPGTKFPGQDQFPNMTIDELNFLNIGPDPNAPQYSQTNTYSALDNISWIKGAHNFKFGFEYRKWISPQLFIQRSRGDYEWSTLEDYVNDRLPDFGERSFGAVGYSGDQQAIYWFANDTWKVKSNLSLNLGVRYEYTGVPYGWKQQSLNDIASVPGLISFAAPRAPKTNFMPRIGFAWTPKNDSNWSVRGGFGMAYDILYDNIGTLARPPQIGSTADCAATQTGSCTAAQIAANGAFLANGGIPPQQSSGITVLDQADARDLTSSQLPVNVKYPYSENWNLGIQHVFGENYTVEMRYVGTRGLRLDTQIQPNRRALVTPSAYLPTYYADPGQAALDALTNTLAGLKAPGSMVPAYAAAGFGSTITAFLPEGSSTYHGLQTQLNRRFSNGLQFQAAWTWSHTIDNSTADFFSTVLTPRRAQDGLNLGADRANSALNHAHRLSFAAVYELPFFKASSSWAMKNIVGNWQFSPTYIFETGQWADVQSGVDANLNGDNAGDRAVYNAAGISGAGSGVQALKNTAGDTVAYLALVPGGTTACGTSAACGQYIVAGAGALATAGRNTLQMRPINNVDLGVKKRINFTEALALEGGAQFFNIFNHAQYVGNYINDVGSNGLTGVRSYLIPSSSNFNNAPAVFTNNPRSIQVYLKFTF